MAAYDGQSGVGGRIRRYARVTGTMSGLAARLAGERYLGMDVDRNKHAAQLREALGGLKGPLMKVAQILSTIPTRCRQNMQKNWLPFRRMLRLWAGCL